MMSKTVLVIAAHPDDEVIGCGGTMARLAAEGSAVHLLVLADGETARNVSNSDSQQLVAVRANAAHRAAQILGCANVQLHEFPDNRLDTIALLDVVRVIEDAIDRVKPEIVFSHHAGDVNVDHRVVHDAVLAACRPQPNHPVRQLYYYEVASSTEWRTPHSGCPFVPNTFIDISKTLATKRRALEIYDSEMRAFPHARSFEALEALARWRGTTVGVAAAEAFVLGRAII